jgi:hypothetical protein
MNPDNRCKDRNSCEGEKEVPMNTIFSYMDLQNKKTVVSSNMELLLVTSLPRQENCYPITPLSVLLKSKYVVDLWYIGLQYRKEEMGIVNHIIL